MRLDDPNWLTPSEAARILGLSVRHVQRLGDEQSLICVHTPLGRLFRLPDLEAFAAKRARS
jgi:excisionase family DNA binding protein